MADQIRSLGGVYHLGLGLALSAAAAAAAWFTSLHLNVQVRKRRPPPRVSARAWCIADVSTRDILWSSNERTVMQIASITKLVTALVLTTLPTGWEDEIVTVSDAAAQTNRGTKANLAKGQKFSAVDLLYALMLPSGNDAAVALAEHFGGRFEVDDDAGTLPSGDFYLGDWSPQSAVGRFVAEMNRFAENIGAVSTKFVNPHGMSHPSMKSCVEDVLLFSIFATQHSLVQRVCNTRSYTTSPLSTSLKPWQKQKRMTWVNTNELLDFPGNSFKGLKTGWIPNVDGQRIHGCLSVLAERPGNGQQIIIIVLGCKNKSLRFVDVALLAQYAWDNIEKKDG